MTAGPNLIGARLGGYEVQALIGSGGMASVYRAFGPNLQRPVAIKGLSSTTARSRISSTAFARRRG